VQEKDRGILEEMMTTAVAKAAWQEARRKSLVASEKVAAKNVPKPTKPVMKVVEEEEEEVEEVEVVEEEVYEEEEAEDPMWAKWSWFDRGKPMPRSVWIRVQSAVNLDGADNLMSKLWWNNKSVGGGVCRGLGRGGRGV
jgi:hypothetical protein